MLNFRRRGISAALLLTALSYALPAVAQTTAAPEPPMKPKIAVQGSGAFQCDTAPALLIGKAFGVQGAKLVLNLQEQLQSRFGTPIAGAAPEKSLPKTPYMLIGLLQDRPELRKLAAAHKNELPKTGLGDEGFVLEVTPEHVLVAAAKPAGAFYGAEAVLRMDTAGGKGLAISAITAADWPTLAWRGMHLLVGGRGNLPALERILTDYMPRYRLNQLMLEINYNFRFKSHPEMASGDGFTVEDCRHLKDLADRNAVKLVPMINCLGHQSWAENTMMLLKVHPEFDETPDYPADNKGIYCRSWCPSHPDIYKFVCDLADELIDAFDATAFHVGMDEVFILGKCPRCKGIETSKLVAKAVNSLHDHLVGKRKVTMMMWGDRLLDGKATGYGEWEASENGTWPAIDMIPKDVVLCDWHYENSYAGKPATYPSVRLFQDKGLRVWPSAWNSEENVRLIMQAALKDRTDRMVGYLATTWIGTQPVANGLAGDEKALANKETSGVVAAIRLGGRMAWQGDAAVP